MFTMSIHEYAWWETNPISSLIELGLFEILIASDKSKSPLKK